MKSFARTAQTLLFGALLIAAGWREARAAVLPVEVDFTIRLAFGMYAGGELTTSGSGVATVNGSGAGLHLDGLVLPASLFATTGLAVPVTDPAVFPVNGLQLTAMNGAGSVADSGGSVGGVVPLAGVFKICLYSACSGAVANINVPLPPVGAGGTATLAGAVNVSVYGAPWTTGTAMVGVPGYEQTITGFAHGPASGTSSTAQPGGTLQLVTPILVSTNIAADNTIGAFAILTVRFVPEPTTGLLLVAGIAVLGRVARARR